MGFWSEKMRNDLKSMKKKEKKIAIFIFWEMVNFILKILTKLGFKDFCEPDSETLTSDTR